jgi:hypothetical protein
MHESYEDCPYWEQLQYAFDTRLEILFTYAVSADTRLARKTIDDFHCSRLPEGIIQSRCPSNVTQIIPTFAFSWISMLRDYYQETGDSSILEEYRFTMESILYWFRLKKNAEGFIENLGYWNYVDWSPEWGDNGGAPHAVRHGPSTIQNLMYVSGLEEAAGICEILSLPDLSGRYRAEAAEIKALVRRRCFDTAKGLFKEGPDFDGEYSQHAQMWAVLTGTVNGREKERIMQKALTEPGIIRCTFPLSFYFFRALEEAGLYDKTASLWDPWKALLDLDLSTLPETPFDSCRSDCHAWSSLLLYEYPVKLLGVYAAEPGYKTIGVKPIGLWAGSAKGRVFTPAGEVEAAWTVREGVFSISGKTPGKTVVTLPDGSVHETGTGAFKWSVELPAD